MKKNILLLIAFLVISAGISTHANSMELVPINGDASESGIGFTYSIKNTNDKISNTFMAFEPISLQFTIKVKTVDVGQSGSVYLVAKYQGKWYQKSTAGIWQPWDMQTNSLSPFSNKTLEKQENITVLKNEVLGAGEVLLYGGYQTTENQQIFYNSIPASLLVFDKDNAAFHQVNNDQLLASYFAHGALTNADFNILGLPSVATADAAISNDSSSSSPFSQTNLQERGVDEADRIKTDGEHVYVLENCDSSEVRQCISSYAIEASPASNTLLERFDIGSNTSQKGGVYLAELNNKKHIIYQGDSSNFGVSGIWYSPYYWQDNHTDIKIVDVSQPQNMKVSTHITMDTSILSTRLIDGVLYLITRKNSYYDYPLPLDDSLIATTTEQQNIPTENPTVPENQFIDDLLPTISFNDGSAETPVVKATDCYIPSKTSNKRVDNSIITITAIPLDNPKSHYSTCITGAVDTFYMSKNALYLATSLYSNSVVGNDITFFPENSEMTTEIHKFSLAEGTLDYRGSGAVEGHLGWEADKQPFRMGDYNDILKVATSKGDTWDNSSTTRVSVLREATSERKGLEEIGFLDNLGKPGERLFAARFIKNRGYLVTFKQTDPLFVLDFNQPELPKVLAAIEVNGYSDYLHPVGDDYLLGIGKDAIANENPDFGAYFQGVQVSLYDVSTGGSFSKVAGMVLGKRGTESAVLSDHHALAWLDNEQGDSATLAIPVQLNTQQGNNFVQDYSHPSSYYEWTHTGLYTFNINTGANPSIELQGKLITDIPPEQCNESGSFCSFRGQFTVNDRAVIQQDTVHYFHNNAAFSSTIDDLE